MRDMDGLDELGAERAVKGLDVTSLTPAEIAAQEAENKERTRLQSLATARGWPGDPYATMSDLKYRSENNPPPRTTTTPVSYLPPVYTAPAAGGFFAAKSCGAVGMDWSHFLAIAIFIACLVAAQYAWQQYSASEGE